MICNLSNFWKDSRYMINLSSEKIRMCKLFINHKRKINIRTIKGPNIYFFCNFLIDPKLYINPFRRPIHMERRDCMISLFTVPIWFNSS